MSITLKTPYLLTSLLAVDETRIIALLQGNKNYINEGINALALLVINVSLAAIKALEKCDYKSFDANPGDGGCQIRALELRRLVQDMHVKKECHFLQEAVLKIKKALQVQRNNIDKSGKSLEGFLTEQFGSLKVSKELEYLLHCYLSAKLKVAYYTHENGVVMTRSDVSQLGKFSKNIDRLESVFRKKIVEKHQKRLSILSVEALRISASRLGSLHEKEKEVLITMLSEQHTHLFTPDKKFEPKAFGCLFYQIKTLLVSLREEQGLVWPEKHCA